jgi:nucleoside-diphosphate-sugar epimerase
MLIALTGATGFVGRQVLRSLTERGQRVRAIVRHPEKLSSVGKSDLVEVAETGDLFEESPARLKELLGGVDTLVHSAWYAEPGSYLTSERNITCLKGTLELARSFSAVGGTKFVGIGSCAEYQPSTDVLTVDSPLAPQSLYAATKVASYNILSHLFAKTNISFAWTRLFYLYGEGEDIHRLVPYVTMQLLAGEEVLLTDGQQVRDYLDVAEAGRLIADVAVGSQQGAVNICSGEGVTVREFVESIADQFGRRDLLRFGARASNLFDPPFVVGELGLKE